MNITCRPKVVPKLGAERSAVEPAPHAAANQDSPVQSRDRARTTLSTKPIRRSADPRVRLAIRIAIECGRGENAHTSSPALKPAPATSPLHVISRGGHERIVPIGDEFAAELLAGSRVYV